MADVFPKDFLWGAAISSYQTEGNNFNSDWWEWEQKGKTKEKSGRACDYWKRYKSDHNLLTELGVNAFRLSLEWSRIEPEEGKFSEEAINHYREILQDLRNRNIKTVVTFCHYTTPLWFTDKYNWHRREAIEFFSRYTENVYKELGDLINICVIFNEPFMQLGSGFFLGSFPPGFKSPIKFYKAVNNLTSAHIESYKKIHALNSKALVGITYLYNWFDFYCKPLKKIVDWARIDFIGEKIKNYQDYFGLDYYRRNKIKFNPSGSSFLGFGLESDKNNVMFWPQNPEGIYKVLLEVKQKYGTLPVYILENGYPSYAGINDEYRIKYIREHLKYIQKAMHEGIDVRGYFHWSLLDNFEWTWGFVPKFGLVEINHQTLERKPRKSFYAYKQIIKENSSS